MTGPRFSRSGDEAGLRTLWKQVFGDSNVFLDTFFREIYVPGMAAVMEDEGVIVSAADCVPFGAARYIYAVATDPAYRGRGCAKAACLQCIHEVLSRGKCPIWSAEAENTASLRLAESVGFVRLGDSYSISLSTAG